MRQVEAQPLAGTDDGGEVVQDLYLLGGIAGIGNQSADDGNAELLGEPLLRQVEQLLRDGLAFGGLHQAEDFVVVALALEEDVPHAAGGADEDQPLRLQILAQGEAEVGDGARAVGAEAVGVLRWLLQSSARAPAASISL